MGLRQRLQIGSQLLQGMHHVTPYASGVIVEELEQVGNLSARIGHGPVNLRSVQTTPGGAPNQEGGNATRAAGAAPVRK